MSDVVAHRCIECGDDVVRTGNRGNWPSRCFGCRTAYKRAKNRAANRLRRARFPEQERARVRAIHKRNPEANRARVAAWQAANPDRVAAQRAKAAVTVTPEQRRNWTLRSRYGITLDEQREMWARQDGLCLLCDVELVDDPHGFAVDHDHATGQVRGLLCQLCNVCLRPVDVDPTWAARAVAYVTATERPWLPQRLQKRKEA